MDIKKCLVLSEINKFANNNGRLEFFIKVILHK